MTGALSTRSIVIAALGLAALAGVLLAAAPFLRIVDNALNDAMVSTISPWTRPPDNIVLVTISETTLSRFPYRSPVDRDFLADTLSAILSAGPRAVGLDILLDQPTEAQKDARLRRVLDAADRPVVLAHAGSRNGLTEGQISYMTQFSDGLISGAVDLGTSPIDGTVRSLITGVDADGTWIPGFAVRIAMGTGINTVLKSGPEPLTYYRTADGVPHEFKAYPAETVGLLPAAWLKDKYVLIGVDLPDSDRHRTSFHLLNGPVTGDLPGIAIHAHGLAQILTGDRLVKPAAAWQMLIAALLCAATVAVAYLGLNPVLRLALMLGLCLSLWVAVMVVFSRFGFLLPPAAPTLAMAMAGGTAFAHVWHRDRRQRGFIKDAFSRYVSPAYVERLIKHPEELHLGGDRREVSYIFTDIAGFTSLSEQIEPTALSKLLTSYLDGVCGLFLEHGATIDKIIGDAVVGFVGAPVDQPDHAARTVSLMLAIDEFCEAFRAEQLNAGHIIGETRIGAHTGVAVIGNFGGSQFFDYTGFGDNVNIAARLEGANKYFGTRLCVSRATATASGWPHFRPVGTILLKGKTQGIDVFEPVPATAAQRPEFRRYLKAYDMLKAGTPDVLEHFTALALDCPEDPLVVFHLERLHQREAGIVVTLSGK